MLQIKNLCAEVGETKILKGLSINVKAGEVHAIMGPNGSGKSTLSYTLAGRDGYNVTSGSTTLDGQNLLDLKIEERAAKGLFLAFQYPVEISGVSYSQFLKTAINAQRKARGQEPLDALGLLKKIKAACEALGVSQDMISRQVNSGFSGGEKKRAEVLQMMLLEPKLAILDETDSGLDIDALKVVAQGVNSLRDPKRSFIVITHYQRLLDYIVPDFVHILSKGKIIKSGGAELARELETTGYQQ